MRKKGIKALILIALASIIWCAHKICIIILSTQAIHFTFDPLLSDSQQEKITFGLNQGDIHNPLDIINFIKNKCPAVSEVKIARNADSSLHVDVIAAQPLFLINNNWALTAQGKLAQSCLYEPRFISSLMHISMKIDHNNMPVVSNSFKQWLGACDPAIFKKFAIEWHHDHEIWLIDKKSPQIKFICHCFKPFDTSLLSYQEIIAQLKNEKIHSGTKGLMWVADVRFEKQIIVSAPKGEGLIHG